MSDPSQSTGGPEVIAYVMGHTIKDGDKEGSRGQLGACPHSLRVLLTLEEKGVLYKVDYINLKNKPEWFVKANPVGTVPMIKDVELDQFIVDSGTICDYLEDKYGPGKPVTKKSLGKLADVPHTGAKLLEHFVAYVKGGDASARTALEEELRSIEEALPNSHPFFGGKDVSSWDMAMAPRLYLARVGCKNLRDWDFAADQFPNILKYEHRMTGRPSWRNSASWDEQSIVEDMQAWSQEK